MAELLFAIGATVYGVLIASAILEVTLNTIRGWFFSLDRDS